MSELKNFYTGKSIFITGVTGFLGQVLLEKLLRSFHEIGIIYVLIRDKKGKNVRERVDTLLAGPLFDKLRIECPNYSEKMVPVPGDITKKGLGLSVEDYDRIVNEVSVIFHLAATVRFTEKLDVAVAVNVNSVKHVIEIAEGCKNLKCGVYLSTAYSHCVQDLIKEEVYPPPLSYEAVNKLIESRSKEEFFEDAKDDVTKTVLGKWPNTYSFTKAIGESVVAEFAKELPFAIFRPSIVTCIYEEPVPGWLLSPTGLAGLTAGIGLGITHVLRVDENLRVDLVPVDYLTNALISCAWETAINGKRKGENIPVYNYVSGSENPITWKWYMLTMDGVRNIYPLNSAIYKCTLVSTKSKFVFSVLELLLHVIPALVIDNVARLFGETPQMYKMARKIGNAVRALGYFTTREWTFENRRVQDLWKRLTPEDRIIFPFDIRNVDWDYHSVRMVKGIRKYLVDESDENLEEARRRNDRLHIVHTSVKMIFGMFLLWITWQLLQGIGLVAGTSSATM